MGSQLPARRDLCLGLFSGLAISSLPSLARAQTTPATPPAGSPSPDIALPPNTTADLATRTDANNLLTVAVHINGTGPFQFVVDTGAERTVLAENVATQLNLNREGLISISGLARKVSANVVTVSHLDYGPFTKTDLEAPILPRALLEADGFLGLDVIRNSKVVFDFKNHLLRIDRPTGFVPDHDPDIQTVIIRARGNYGHLRMSDCRVDGIDTVAFVDTGAEVSVGNQALYNALHQRRPHLADLGTAVLSGVTGGEIRGPIVPVGEIALQSLRFNGGSIAACDVDDFAMWGLADRPALLIGMDYLRQFASVAIDFRSKEVKFELAENTSPPPRVRIV